MSTIENSPVAQATPTIAAREIDGVRVAIHSAQNPSAADWEQALDWTRNQLRTATRPIRYLVLTQGGAPNSVQRAAFGKLVKGQAILTAIVTSSAFTRGMVTAMAWFNRNIRPFPEDDIDSAFLYLGVPPTDFEKFRQAIVALRKQLR